MAAENRYITSMASMRMIGMGGIFTIGSRKAVVVENMMIYIAVEEKAIFLYVL